jgi:uncharacterized phage-associated protein
MDSRSVANYFIQKAIKSGNPITQMKLLKLVYIAHGWHLGNFDKPLIDSTVQAWQYGPVIPDLYQAIRKYGRVPIINLIPYCGTAGDQDNPWPEKQTQQLLDLVWNNYSGYTAIQLSAITHQANTPWDKIWNQEQGCEYSGARIPNELIKEYYHGKIQGQNKSGA